MQARQARAHGPSVLPNSTRLATREWTRDGGVLHQMQQGMAERERDITAWVCQHSVEMSA